MAVMMCRICGQPSAYEIEVEVSRRQRRRSWFLVVCSDCWRVFEAQMDQGAARVQQGLDFDPRHARGTTWWFV